MKPSSDSTSNRPAAAEPPALAGLERAAERARLERPFERPSFDLLNALLPEWPAQACSWA